MADEAEDANEDIDADAEGEGEEGSAKKGGLKKLILFIGLPAIIVILGGVAGVLMFTGGGDEEELAEAESEYSEGADGSAPVPALSAETYESMPIAMTVTFDAGGNAESRMRIGIVLVSEDPLVTEWETDADVPTALRDTYLEFLRTLRVEDVNGSMGTFRLRSELLRRTNLVLAPITVEQVLITELLIQ